MKGVTGGLLIKMELLLITSVRQFALGVPFIRGEVRLTLEPTVFHSGEDEREFEGSPSSIEATETRGAGDSMVDWGVLGDNE